MNIQPQYTAGPQNDEGRMVQAKAIAAQDPKEAAMRRACSMAAQDKAYVMVVQTRCKEWKYAVHEGHVEICITARHRRTRT